LANWKRIIIHCSDSPYGNTNVIRDWHVNGNGWDDIGYHYTILNGMIGPRFYLRICDGSIEAGRPIDGDNIIENGEKGAHAYGYNSNSIGICLIGKDKFTPNQLHSLALLINELKKRFDIEEILGHYEVDPKKTCPNLDMDMIRYLIAKTGV
jgi:hypothetical protein